MLKLGKRKSGKKNLRIDHCEDYNSLYLNNVTGRIKTAGSGCRLSESDFTGDIELGRFVSIWGPNIRVVAKIEKIKIGSFSSVAANTFIINYDHRSNRPTTYFINKNIFGERDMLKDIYSNGPIILGEDVWIGANSVVLGGVTVGRGSIIAAGSVVARDIPPYSIAGGSPAKVIKSRFTEKSIDILEESRWWTWSIDELNQNKSFFSQELK